MGGEMNRLNKAQWVEVFRAARSILTTKGWSQGEFARGSSQRPCPPTSQDACSFCLSGAVCRAIWDRGVLWPEWRRQAEGILEQFIPEPDATRGYSTIPDFNDQTDFEGVLALLDNAIKTLEKEIENEPHHE